MWLLLHLPSRLRCRSCGLYVAECSVMIHVLVATILVRVHLQCTNLIQDDMMHQMTIQSSASDLEQRSQIHKRIHLPNQLPIEAANSLPCYWLQTSPCFPCYWRRSVISVISMNLPCDPRQVFAFFRLTAKKLSDWATPNRIHNMHASSSKVRMGCIGQKSSII